MTDGGGVSDNDRLVLAAPHGPAWSGEPPYDNDYVYGKTRFERPTLKCQKQIPGVVNPSWSSDGRQLAYGAADGVHVLTIPSLDDCSSITDRLLVPGGKDPAFGPADVDPSQDPARRQTAQPSPQPQAGGGAGLVAPRVTRFGLSPKTFRRGRGTTVRFILNAPASLKLTVTGGAGRRVPGSVRIAGAAGANKVRRNGRLAGRSLKPGAYRLSVTTSNGGKLASANFRVRRWTPLR